MKTFISILVITALSVPVVSIASFGGGKGYEDGLFWSADLDRNEWIDRDEAKEVYNLAQEEIFARFDEDSNGLINRSEFREFLQHSPWVNKFVHPSEKE